MSLCPNNIDLAFRRKVEAPKDIKEQFSKALAILKEQNIPENMLPTEPIYYEYIPFADEELTISNIIKEKKWWSMEKCNLSYKEEHGLPIGQADLNETIYVRFIMSK